MKVDVFDGTGSESLTQLLIENNYSSRKIEKVLSRFTSHDDKQLYVAIHERTKRVHGYCLMQSQGFFRVAEENFPEILHSHAHIVDLFGPTEDPHQVKSKLLYCAKEFALAQEREGVWVTCKSNLTEFYEKYRFVERHIERPSEWTDDRSSWQFYFSLRL